MLKSRHQNRESQQALFEALLDQHRGIVHKVAGTYARATEDRRDLVQEICAQMWRAFGRYDSARPFPTWAYRIALNVAISHVRRTALRDATIERIEPNAPEPSDPNAPLPDDNLRVAALYHVIDRLGDFDRALLLLHLEGYANAEIGDVLGISQTNASTRLSRLRTRLKADLNPSPTH